MLSKFMSTEKNFLELLMIIRTTIDFGLVVLIWLVQVIIYPSFLYTTKEHLCKWHQTYTNLISFFVIPLMFSQLFLVLYLTYKNPNLLNITSCMMVGLAWLSTLVLSVPLHSQIAQGSGDEVVLQSLVSTNWPRTLVWTLCFILGATQLL